MKLTLEPTEANDVPPYNTRVELTLPSDDLNFEEFMELMRAAALAWGFSPVTVTEYFDKE